MYADIILKNQLGALDVICETLHGQNGLKEFQKNAIDAKETVPMIVPVLRRILDKSGVELKSNFVLKSIDWTLPFFSTATALAHTPDEENAAAKALIILGLMCSDHVAIQFILADNDCLRAALGTIILR